MISHLYYRETARARARVRGAPDTIPSEGPAVTSSDQYSGYRIIRSAFRILLPRRTGRVAGRLHGWGAHGGRAPRPPRHAWPRRRRARGAGPDGHMNEPTRPGGARSRLTRLTRGSRPRKDAAGTHTRVTHCKRAHSVGRHRTTRERRAHIDIPCPGRIDYCVSAATKGPCSWRDALATWCATRNAALAHSVTSGPDLLTSERLCDDFLPCSAS